MSADMTNREELHSAWWEGDLANHASLVFKTNQDERLKGPVTMFPPGYGPVGGGWGWGSPAGLALDRGGERTSWSIPCATTVTNLQTVQNGHPDIRQRWEFPIDLEVPKRANMSVVIKLSLYAKELLKAIPGPHWWEWLDTVTVPIEGDPSVTKVVKAACFGVQCTINGERLIQQRGDYHA